jgi:hypothetical protein
MDRSDKQETRTVVAATAIALGGLIGSSMCPKVLVDLTVSVLLRCSTLSAHFELHRVRSL